MVDNWYKRGMLALALFAATLGPASADLSDISDHAKDVRVLEVDLGYRAVDTDGTPSRAAEYAPLEDSMTGGVLLQHDDGDRAFLFRGAYRDPKDYDLGLSFDYKALLRLNLREERMVHNLDHIPYAGHPDARDPAVFVLANTPADVPVTRVTFSDPDPGRDYQRRITLDEVTLRGKLPEYPAHLNLSYWRFEKKGAEQLRFVNENCAAACHMQSRTREVDRVTEEVTAGFDAHLGPVDIAFLQTLREFREKERVEDSFTTHVLRYFGPPRTLEHDAIPESRLSETTFMINLPPSGGFTSAASYTIGQRENRSSVVGVTPTDPETDYQKLAADVTYTPGERWTFNLRYRMFELDSENPNLQNSNGVASPANPFFFSGIPVRESIDIDRDNYAATAVYRPSGRLTLKGEYEREEIRRSDTGLGEHHTFDGVYKDNWALPSHEVIDRFRLGFSSRLLEKSTLKLNGWVEHRNVDEPAYGISLSSSNNAFLSATYAPSPFWGANASLDVLRGRNDARTVILLYDDDGNGATPGLPVPYDLDRHEARENFALGAWITPNEVISADLNYGLLQSRIAQDVLFGSTPDPTDPGGPNDHAILDDDAEYDQRVHTLSAGVNVRFTKILSCRVEGYHIRSKARFSPGFDAATYNYLLGPLAGDAVADPTGLEEASELDIRQNGVKTRVRWDISPTLAATFEFTYDDYDDRRSSAYDGTRQTYLASLTGVF